ncbi:MAG: M56 family metallopeptidase [Candidatus Humimicrobiaceae bacterium]
MNETIKLILSLSLSGSILAVLIFAVKPFIKHKLSKSIQYYILIVVLLRFIIPFSFEGSIMNDVFYSNKTPLEISSQGTVQPMANASENIINSSILPNVRENATNTVLFHSAINNFRDLFNQYALYLWLLGIIIALTVNLTGYARFSKHLKQANKPATDDQNRILASLLNGRNNVRLVRNRFSTTPMLIGILRPYIIIPDINFNEKQLKNILLHEIAHLKHFDIGVKWLTMIAASIHWFNPLMYFIKKEINHACELACDEAVIGNLNPAEKQAYGDTLISVVSENKYPMGILQAAMSEEKETLKERLVAIMKYNKKSKSIILMSIMLLIAFISGLCYLVHVVVKPTKMLSMKRGQL